MASRRTKVALSVACVVGAAIAAFGPLVRHEAAGVAERYGGDIAIEHVSPTWHGVALRGVDVTLDDVPSVHVHLNEVDVSLGLHGRSIALHGGKISAVGARDVVLHEVETWRAHHRASTDASPDTSNARSTPLDLAGLDVVWNDRRDDPTESVLAKGVRYDKLDGGLSINADEVELGLGASSVSLKSAQVTLRRRSEGGYGVGGLSARSVSAEVTLPPGELERVERSDGDREGPPKDERPRATSKRPQKDALDDVVSKGRGEAIQRRLIAIASLIDRSIEADAKIALSKVDARIRRGSEALHLGPGDLSIKRDSGRLKVELSPGGAELGSGAGDQTQQALTFRLSVPIGETSTTSREIEADVRGGPIWLSTLGVRDGDFGLFDVARASIVTRSHVVLSADGRDVRVDGDGKVQRLAIRSAALSDEPVEGIDVSWRAKASIALDGSRVKVDDGEVDLGAIQMTGHGLYEKGAGEHKIRGDFDVPLAACQSMFDSIPKGLAPRLQGMKMAGSFALRGKAQIDTTQLDRDFKLDWDISSSCRITEAPIELKIDRFRKPFRRVAFGVDGERAEIESGPQSPGWVPYGAISKFMEIAVLTTEDGGFFRHSGFDHEAIKNSIRENLRKRRFVRGASTISMQLAKNLYLDKTKNLSRKLQEAVLTMYLEQELTKEQIMELYLNVIEFGPMVYGIGHAARFYFNASASELSLAQALYIASILPNPKVQHFAAGGALTEAWTSYLRKLMTLAHDRKRISDEELEEGLREIVVRGSPAPHRSAADESGPVTNEPMKEEPEPPQDPGE